MGWLGNKTATVVDLFAGTGGMGLATLLTPELKSRATVVLAAEIDEKYLAMIQQNYDYFSSRIGSSDQIPQRLLPVDIGSRQFLDSIVQLRRKHGGLTLLLAGPPCQGFSKSNQMSRQHTNPQNLLALKTVDVIKAGRPRIALIENVPGIQTMASYRRPKLTVTEHIELELSEAGYRVTTALLDAANYGVPQHRLRSFTVAIRADLAREIALDNPIAKGRYGPSGLLPYRTVRDAFSDLPGLDVGSKEVVMKYPRPAGSSLQRELRKHSTALFDHVTTSHSPMIVERYAAIRPGENWRAIRKKLRNYAQVDNTHTNIYHRLHPDLPARTVGNFRKSMTVHPWEDRGLSVREAARLQSLPDWLRFFDDQAELYRGHLRGLSYRQQQVGNAVCFRLTGQLVSHLFSNA
jgi:DNA-cytosine methyltransferase